METGHHHVRIFADREALNEAAAELFCTASQEAVGEHETFYVALAGGSTPEQLYRRLTQTPWRMQVEWRKVRFFFGDERAVPHKDRRSNYCMARTNLFEPLAIDEAQQYPIPTGCMALQHCADTYAEKLAQVSERGGLPAFDLCLLGMGEDGHTASLFPGTKVLDERERWVKAVYVPGLNAWRLTLTLPVINNARRVVVMVSGEGKADVLRRAIHEPAAGLPIQRVQPADGLWWYVDEAAAAGL